VVASTDKVYGESRSLPYRETDPLAATHPYDVSKACADMLSQSYYGTYDLPVAITRCGNIFGGGDLNFNRIVPGTIKSLSLGQQPVIRSNGKMLRDYVYVKDIVSANMLLAEFLWQGKEKGEAFNFSYGEPRSVLDVVSQTSQLMGSKAKPIILNEAKNEILEQYLSAQKAKERLGWAPSWSFKSGLTETIGWYKENIFR